MQCWKLGARGITSLSVCRCACHLMIGLLQRNVIEYREVNDTMDSMLASVDLSGPALFCDSSARLWCALIQVKARHAPALVYQASQRILNWLIVRWRPCKFQLSRFWTDTNLFQQPLLTPRVQRKFLRPTKPKTL